MSKKRLCELDNYEKISTETKINKKCKIFTFKNNNKNFEKDYEMLYNKILNIKIDENTIPICNNYKSNNCESKNLDNEIFVDNKNLCKIFKYT